MKISHTHTEGGMDLEEKGGEGVLGVMGEGKLQSGCTV